jgi:hypothetical protein
MKITNFLAKKSDQIVWHVVHFLVQMHEFSLKIEPKRHVIKYLAPRGKKQDSRTSKFF